MFEFSNQTIILIVSFIISALYGFIMKWSRLFAILEDTYYKGLEKKVLSGANYRIGIIKARWNSDITDSLYNGCRQALYDCGVKEENIIELQVPGSYELVSAPKTLLDSGKVDGFVPIGTLI